MGSTKKGLLAVLIIALVYLCAYYYLDFRNGILLNKDCEKTETGFSLKPKDFYLRVRSPADLRFTFNKDIDSLHVVWKEESQTSQPVKISNRQWAFRVDEEADIARVDLVPVPPEPRALTMRITRAPRLKISFLSIQFLMVGLFVYWLWEFALWLWSFIFGKNGVSRETQNRVSRACLMAVSGFFLYVLFNASLYSNMLLDWQVPLARGMLLNMIFAVVLAAGFWGLSKARPKPIVWPVLFSALIILLTPKFNLEICGDAQIWLRVISSAPGQLGNYNAATVSFAEALSVLLGKGILALSRIISPAFEPASVYLIMAKAQGVFYAFMLYLYVFRREGLTERQKGLVYFLAAALPASAFFLGFPEFSFYALPFLLLFLILAERYLKLAGGDRRLLFAALALAVGGLFHGSAWFCLPILLILPILKFKKFPARPAAVFFGKSAVLLMTGVVLPFLFLLGVSELAGTKIVYHTALGGAGGDLFVKTLPSLIRYWHDKCFSEKAYIFQRGWLFLIGFPLLLFFLGYRRPKQENRPEFRDSLLLLAAMAQMAIPFFWGFDLNIKDFDLYMIPQTLFMLFLLNKAAGADFLGERTRGVIAFVFLWGLTSPIGLLIAMTCFR